MFQLKREKKVSSYSNKAIAILYYKKLTNYDSCEEYKAEVKEIKDEFLSYIENNNSEKNIDDTFKKADLFFLKVVS